jgi:hypothetical protein
VGDLWGVRFGNRWIPNNKRCGGSMKPTNNSGGRYMLILPIKKKWFDMILSGEKKEEYREIKPYYDTRFLTLFGCIWVGKELVRTPLAEIKRERVQKIAFRNGYGKNAPTILADCELRVGKGREEWGGDPSKLYYVLEIKKIEEGKE